MSPATISKQNKVCVFHELNGELKHETWATPDPATLNAHQVLVKVHYSGVCHTDLHAHKGDWPVPPKTPLVGGHEGAGEIVALGQGNVSGFKVGDRVGIKWIADCCGNCQFCKQGYEPLCKKAELSGYTVDGSFQQYAVAYVNSLNKIPDGLSYQDAAPIMCAGVTVYKALKESNARAGEWVVIPGAGGGLGHLAVQYARYMGLRVIAIDSGEEKKRLCEKLGAETWIDFKQTKDMVKAVQEATHDGLGPHAAIVAAASPGAYEQALEYIRPHGTVVAVGLPPDTKVKADVFFTVFHSKRLVGSYVGNRQDCDEALAIAATGHVKTLYEVKPFSYLKEVYEKMENGTQLGRVVLDLNA